MFFNKITNHFFKKWLLLPLFFHSRSMKMCHFLSLSIKVTHLISSKTQCGPTGSKGKQLRKAMWLSKLFLKMWSLESFFKFRYLYPIFLWWKWYKTIKQKRQVEDWLHILPDRKNKVKSSFGVKEKGLEILFLTT